MVERQYWWVSQGATFRQSLHDNILWAPQSDKRNRTWFYWDNVAKVKEGDVIFHFADGAIRAVSVATSGGHASGVGRTVREGGNGKGRRSGKGWRVNVQAYELSEPVSIEQIGPKLVALNMEKGPVNHTGGASPGYLYELPADAVESIVQDMSLDGLPAEMTELLDEWKVREDADVEAWPSLSAEFHHQLMRSDLTFSQPFVRRFVASLLAKRFVILTGLSGSGKTRLAQAFAQWATPNRAFYELVAVGADWTGNENIVGYPDRLNGGYVRTSTLNLMLHAREYRDTPHVLILDEMNLSHVERYFADLLSAIESGEPMVLHNEDRDLSGVPPRLTLPDNLFVIGTINVDETTYLFSPKVLDRANVIEFRASREEMAAYLDHPGEVVAPDEVLSELSNGGARFSMAFAEVARAEPAAFSEAERRRLKAELLLLFDMLAEHNAEFGFRVASEIERFMAFYKQLAGDDDWFNAAMDAQIVQKLLPKLNGSRPRLAPVLGSLLVLCREWERPPVTADGYDTSSETWRNLQVAQDKALTAASDDPAYALLRSSEPRYPISAEKLARMWRALDANGFVSFTEA